MPFNKLKRCMAKHKLYVAMGHGAVAQGSAVLTAVGLGSCVAIALHDPLLPAGGLAHVMLPDSAELVRPLAPFVCADTALARLLRELAAAGAARHRLVAKLAGGALMFPDLVAPGEGIGREIAYRFKTILDEACIPLVGHDIGGHHGRSVEFDVTTGLLRSRALDWPDRVF